MFDDFTLDHPDVDADVRLRVRVHSMCEDYRAGLGIDRRHDEEDRAAGRKVACPVRLFIALEDDSKDFGDPMTVWRTWADGPPDRVDIQAGHHVAEEAPEGLAAALLEFLA